MSSTRRFLRDLVELGCGQRVVWKAWNPKVPSWTGVQLHKDAYGNVVVLFDHLESPTTVAERDFDSGLAGVALEVGWLMRLTALQQLRVLDPFEPHPDV